MPAQPLAPPPSELQFQEDLLRLVAALNGAASQPERAEHESSPTVKVRVKGRS